MCRYVSEGGESGLRRLNAQIDSLKKEVAEKVEEKESLEERTRQLQIQVTNVEVQHNYCCYYS